MDTKRRVLYTASTDGHLRSFHLPCLAALTEAGWSVTAAAAGDGRGLPPEVGFLSVPFAKRLFSLRDLRAAAILARSIRRERFELILTHTSLAAFYTRLAVMLAGKRNARVVNTVHGYLFDDETPFLRRTLLLAAEKLTACVTDDIIVMNRTDGDIARRHRLCRGRVISVDGMGAPLDRFVPAGEARRREARRLFSLPEDGLVMVCAAEFSRRKNQAMLLSALRRLPEDVFLLLPGDGALLDGCRALAGRLDAADRVRFPGRLDDVVPALAAADLCVSASRSEGLPFHVLEAMSCGLPAVLSDVKGHRDLLEGTEAGRLFPFGDEDAFVRAVEELRRDAGLRAAMGRAARERSARYALSRVLPQLLAAIRGEQTV